MNATPIERIQTMIEHAACVLLAAAVAFAAYRGLSRTLPELQLGLCAAFFGMAAYVLGSRGLFRRSIKRQQFSMPFFEPGGLELSEPDELVLGEADMLHAPPQSCDSQLLILDDIVAELGPNSRVVRLFDRGAMPTPGSLKSRVDEHLRQGRSPAPVPDASQALSEALAELRRSLR